jgi:hypothetical protein
MLISLALPRGAHETCSNNSLAQGLGENTPIVLQGVSIAAPKLSRRRQLKPATGERRKLSLYDGQNRLGQIIENRKRYAAFDLGGRPRGVFPTLKASYAISAVHGGEQ